MAVKICISLLTLTCQMLMDRIKVGKLMNRIIKVGIVVSNLDTKFEWNLTINY